MRFSVQHDEIGHPYPLMMREEWECLSKWAAQAHGHIVEVGTAFGGSALRILEAMPSDAHLTCIDSFEHDEVYDVWADPDETAATLLKLSPHKKWELHCHSSAYIARRFNNPIHLLSLDGDHSYRAVCEDWNSWSPSLAPGAIIALHDSAYNWADPTNNVNVSLPGPTRLVEDLLGLPWHDFLDPYANNRVIHRCLTLPRPVELVERVVSETILRVL